MKKSLIRQKILDQLLEGLGSSVKVAHESALKAELECKSDKAALLACTIIQNMFLRQGVSYDVLRLRKGQSLPMLTISVCQEERSNRLLVSLFDREEKHNTSHITHNDKYRKPAQFF